MSIYLGNQLLAGDNSSFANQDLSNITNTGKEVIAHNSMPSDSYDDLTLGAIGSTYTAPADGYFYWDVTAPNLSFYGLDNMTKGYSMANVANGNGYITRLLIPVNKNDIVSINYQLAPSASIFRFYYAVGSESEQ